MSEIDRPTTFIEYPESNGEPMTESDPTRDYLSYCVEALDVFFHSRRHVYVSGGLCIYYEQGSPRAVVSPDVFVVFGVSKHKRRVYKTWKEGKVPSFVLEVTSEMTRKQDEIDKPQIYASLGIQEYFQYDPTGDYLMPQLKGARLVNGAYQPLAGIHLPDNTFSIHSKILGLDLRLLTPKPSFLNFAADPDTQPKELRFFDPQTGERLLSHREAEEARQEAEQAKLEAEQEFIVEAQARRAAVPRLLAIGLPIEKIAETLSLSIEEVKAVMGH